MDVHSVGVTAVRILVKVCGLTVAVPTAETYVFQEATVDIKQVSSVELKVNNGHQLDQPLSQDHNLDQTVVHAVVTVDTHSSVHQLTLEQVECQRRCTGHVLAVNLAQVEWFL